MSFKEWCLSQGMLAVVGTFGKNGPIAGWSV